MVESGIVDIGCVRSASWYNLVVNVPAVLAAARIGMPPSMDSMRGEESSDERKM